MDISSSPIVFAKQARLTIQNEVSSHLIQQVQYVRPTLKARKQKKHELLNEGQMRRQPQHAQTSSMLCPASNAFHKLGMSHHPPGDTRFTIASFLVSCGHHSHRTIPLSGPIPSHEILALSMKWASISPINQVKTWFKSSGHFINPIS